MLQIDDLHVKVGDREVLSGVDLEVPSGQICVLFGPNGSGKTTLLHTIMGFSEYKIVKGKIYFMDKDITDMPINERAKMGLGILLQRPPNIVGLKLKDLAEAANSGYIDTVKAAEELGLVNFLERDVNVGFSGGELKRSELLQLSVQDPCFLLLDEPESGVDMESIDLVGRKIHNLLYSKKRCGLEKGACDKSALVITHTGQILDYIDADCAYVMRGGQIMCSGRPRDILRDIREKGYGECIKCRMIKL
ncbi:MAG: Fe-S cluster assembly ATP-binding protein [Candidatus Methanomethylophilaceae archaeon]|nr:Fe-S cluster assembly ATP-binding protein [Candidatus Methanomethylophilaceae archaeon]MDI3541795.1 Fe-S cluster assembly ATP-binding protein [Candidatus Methanomethylophilaceae archaeon]HIJ00186.1 ABC transporter ATP-binding protein [Candidatus Methanomethylophilaceae archaeon]